MSVPTTIAMTNEIATRRHVMKNPERNSGKCPWSTSQNSPIYRLSFFRELLLAGFRAGVDLEGVLEGERARVLGRLAGVLADPLVVQLLPGAVRDDVVEHAG